jgi:hypothetical protein
VVFVRVGVERKASRKAARFRFVARFVKIATVAELDERSQAHVDRSAGPDHTANEPNQQSINGSTGIAAILA